MTRAVSLTEEITNIQNGYQIRKTLAMLTYGNNCTTGPLYSDTFTLSISNFTSDKNGYYWCEIVVNGSVSQPSQYAWFYAGSCSQNTYYFNPAAECAEFQCENKIYLTSSFNLVTSYSMSQVTTSSISLASTSSTIDITYTSSVVTGPSVTLVTTPDVTQQTPPIGDEPKVEVLPYVAGFLSLIILLLVSLVTLLLLLYVCKHRRDRRQKIGKSC